ncbi:protein dj-1beta [Toxorhynchites rutilus septentrionalis]|uniref:protein dj-1beta n=1 Tax=Toxorhynchites rutilus septentrionalis TaxID=329112 RepID=UPI0024795F02|nr:protein dj-1beta [Toxorhynchites rutilus septentrionalis]
MAKNLLMLLPHGAEEMEFVICVDVLRRCGVNVTVAGLGGTTIKCSRDVVINADTTLDDAVKNDFDAIALPGGLGGSKAMSESSKLGEVLKLYESKGKLIAAICAAPTVLLTHSIALGKSLTSYPSFKEQLSSQYKYVEDKTVVVDGNLVTSRGPGTAFDFALKLGEILVGLDKTKQVASGMLYNMD